MLPHANPIEGASILVVERGPRIETPERFFLGRPAVPRDCHPSFERLRTDTSGLDRMIGSCWLRGTARLAAGPSGAGRASREMHLLRSGVD